MSPHNKFDRCEPLIRQWLKILPNYIWRLEGLMYMPEYEECVTAMVKHGWDDNSFIDLLNELTDGRFSKGPDVFHSDDFNGKLFVAVLTMIEPAIPGNYEDDGDVSFFWPIKMQMLRSQIETNPRLLAAKRIADLYRDEGGPNDPQSALAFARKILRGRPPDAIL